MKKNQLYTTLIVSAICLTLVIATNSLYSGFEKNRIENRQIYLERSLHKAVTEFKREVEIFAILTAGLRSHIIELDKVPSGPEVQKFILNQLEFVEYGHSILVNYIDKNHNFIFSITQESLTPNDFVGKNVLDLRDEITVSQLDLLLSKEGLVSFPLLNLVEGFVGYPIDFRVKVHGEVVGYIAPIIDIKNILEPIYTNDLKDEFTYRFSYGKDIVFDRERVYDGTVIHNKSVDVKNLNLPKEKYLIAALESYQMPFSIGIAYKNDDSGSMLSFVRYSYIGILSLILFSSLLIYFFFKNITQNKELKISNEDLGFMNKILKKFIFAASHDLKQPLVNIKNFNALIVEKYKDILDEKGQKYLGVISSNIDYMDAILEDLLIYSRVISGEKKRKLVDLKLIVDNIVTETYPDDNIKIIYSNLPQIFGVESELHRLFENLISNAVKFNESDVIEIVITAKENKTFYELSVSDNGIGIKEEHFELIFDEFQRLHKHIYAGTGLGLSICKEIVMNHGGSLTVSNNEISGTEFKFQLKKNA